MSTVVAAAPPPARNSWPLAVVVLVATAWTLLALFAHPVGDLYTESDFYGAYADGAMALRAGHLDPGRYGIYGPGYEAMLAATFAPREALFRVATLLSVTSGAITLASWGAMLAPTLGSGAAAIALALIATNPAFTRYAYAATSDQPAVALASLALALLVRRRDRRAAFAAGVLVALAALTRYQLVAAIAGGAVVAALPFAANRERTWRLGAFLAGVALLALPWAGFALTHGAAPGAGLVRQYGFYAADDPSRNVQDQLAPLPGAPAPVVEPDRWAPVRTGARAFTHLRDDAFVLLGPWLALLALAGAIASRRRLGAGGLLAASAVLVALHLALVPAFYSDRYRLWMVPAYSALAASLVSWARGRAAPVRAGVAVALAAAVAVALPGNATLQREVWAALPTDVIPMARALRSEPGSAPVVSRKGHLGWNADRRTVAFPRVRTLSELAAAARASGAGTLYYSWHEARLRPEFVWMLDTTAVVPGLVRLASCEDPPAVLFRLEAEFGREPGWMADDYARRVREARGAVRAFAGAEASPARAVLAVDALQRGDFDAAIALARRAREDAPDLALAWRVEEVALRAAHRDAEAAAIAPLAAAAIRSEPSRGARRRATAAPPFEGLEFPAPRPAVDVRPGL